MEGGKEDGGGRRESFVLQFCDCIQTRIHMLKERVSGGMVLVLKEGLLSGPSYFSFLAVAHVHFLPSKGSA